MFQGIVLRSHLDIKTSEEACAGQKSHTPYSVLTRRMHALRLPTRSYAVCWFWAFSVTPGLHVIAWGWDIHSVRTGCFCSPAVDSQATRLDFFQLVWGTEYRVYSDSYTDPHTLQQAHLSPLQSMHSLPLLCCTPTLAPQLNLQRV